MSAKTLTLWAVVAACLFTLMAPRTVESAEPKATKTVAASHSNYASQLDKGTLLLVGSVYILVLAGFVGFEVIGRVSPLLHTPLMSATNAISGISLVGSLIAAGDSTLGGLSNFLGFIAVTAATINVVGGFLITDRMLKMFKVKERKTQS